MEHFVSHPSSNEPRTGRENQSDWAANEKSNNGRSPKTDYKTSSLTSDGGLYTRAFPRVGIVMLLRYYFF